MAWSGLVLAFAVFFISHSLPIRPPLRPILERALGPRGFTFAYATLSTLVLIWLIVAAGRAPFVQVWPWAAWQSHAAMGLMLVAGLLLAISIARPNPFSFGGSRNHLFDARNPGPVRLTRHPLLVALAIWSGAHLLANGDLAHVILFGTFSAFAILGGRIIDRRRKREMGEEWARLAGTVRAQPLSAAFRPAGSTAWRIFIGLVIYYGVLVLHPLVIGVNPMP
ncbi:MAG: NnrU family protein [Rhodobacteraceae bacterium]|nr:NnrU family protein [Paracoccaceae bacterium]